MNYFFLVPKFDYLNSESERNRDQNFKFRSWLKFHAPDNIDEMVAALSRKYFSMIDCRECGNCCCSLQIVMEKRDLNTMAKSKHLTPKEFTVKFTVLDEDNDRVLRSPCLMFSGNLCSIYADRPDTCKTFPHLEKPDFVSRLIGVINSLSICPISFYAFEELKEILNWAPDV